MWCCSIFLCVSHIALAWINNIFICKPPQHAIDDWPLSEFSIYDINFRTFMTFISIFYHQNGVFLFSFLPKQHETLCAILFVRMYACRLSLWRYMANLYAKGSHLRSSEMRLYVSGGWCYYIGRHVKTTPYIRNKNK